MPVPRFLLSALLCCASLASSSDLRQVGMVNLPGSPGFAQLAFANGMLLLTHTGASTVDVFDPVRRRLVAQITGLRSPCAVAVDDRGGRVYVGDRGSNSIAVVSTDGWKVIDSIPLPGSPDGLLWDGADMLYWADAGAGTVSLLDLRTKQTTARVEVGGTLRHMVLDSTRHLVFATLQDVHQIIAIDPQLKIVSRFTLQASQPTGLLYDPQYRELYVAVRYAVLAISPDTGAEIDRVAAPAGVDALWLDSGSHTLYAASEGSLLAMHANGRLSAGEEITPQIKAHSVAFDPGRRLVLLPGGREGKSKLLMLRPMTPNAPPGTAQDTEAAVR
ncbi:MAG TPA: YncE family protein [Candidatus Binatia bacterium]|nr:YncE family protein [Candidatus Binatia bacterium]